MVPPPAAAGRLAHRIDMSSADAAAAAVEGSAGVVSGGSASAASAGGAPAVEKRAPGDFVRSLVGRPVGVRLSDGTDYRGILVCLDGFMNVAMEQAEEYSSGVLKSKLGDCFIRGNNGACSSISRITATFQLSFPRLTATPCSPLPPFFSVLYISTPKPKK
jgi:U6 snRNA-associated Sm-like protein LSm6